MHNSAVAVFGMIFVGEIEQKQEIGCLKRKSLNINLFIELLYKINITFVIMLTFSDGERCHSLCDINYMKFYKYRLYIFCPHVLNYAIILNAF